MFGIDWFVAILQGVLGNWVTRILEVLLVPVVVGKVAKSGINTKGKREKSEWTSWQLIALSVVLVASTLVIHENVLQSLASLRSEQGILYEWLNSLGYKTNVETGKDGEIFRITATADINFKIVKTTKNPDVIAIELRVFPQNNAAKAIQHMQEIERTAFMNKIRLELLKFDIEAGYLPDGSINLRKITAIDSKSTRHEFITQFLLFKRAEKLVELFYYDLAQSHEAIKF